MNNYQVRIINLVSHRYLTIDEHILRQVDAKQALIVSEAVGRHKKGQSNCRGDGAG